MPWPEATPRHIDTPAVDQLAPQWSEWQKALEVAKPFIIPLLMGAGAAMTSPNPRRPVVMGRAILGALQGYAAQAPDERAAYYRERLEYQKRMEQRLNQQMQNQDAFIASVPKEQRALAMMDPQGYAKLQLSNMNAGLNRRLLSVGFGIPEAKLATLDSTQINGLASQMILDDFRNKHRPRKLAMKDMVAPGQTEPSTWIVDMDSGKPLYSIGKPAPAASGHGMTQNEAVNFLQKLHKDYQMSGVGEGTPAKSGGFFSEDTPPVPGVSFEQYADETLASIGLTLADLQRAAGGTVEQGATRKPRGGAAFVDEETDEPVSPGVQPFDRGDIAPGFEVVK